MSILKTIKHLDQPWLLFLCVTLLAYAQVFFSEFVVDDFFFLTLVKHIDNPVIFFTHSHFPANLYYRPMGLLLWWGAYHVAGVQFWGHALINAILHACTVWALWQCLQRFSPNRLNAWLALFMATHPIAMLTQSWMSDRFDLLCVLFGLLSVWQYQITLETKSHRAYVCALTTLSLAILSKELGFVLPIVLSVQTICRFISQPNSPKKQILQKIAGVWGLAIAWFACRAWVLRDALNDGIAPLPWLAFMHGIQDWLMAFPAALAGKLFGFEASSLAWLSLLALLALFIANDVRPSWFNKNQTPITPDISHKSTIIGCSLLLACGVLQSPTTAFDHSAHPRFYYFALAGFIFVLQKPWQKSIHHNNGTMRFIGIALLALALSTSLASSLHRTFLERKTRQNTGDSMLAQNISHHLLALSPPQQTTCAVQIEGVPKTTPSFRPYSDVMVKAYLPQTSPWQHCFIYTADTSDTPWYYITPTQSGLPLGWQHDKKDGLSLGMVRFWWRVRRPSSIHSTNTNHDTTRLIYR